MKYIYCNIIFLFLLCSCQNKSKEEKGMFSAENISTENLQTITIEVESTDFENLGDYLETTSYVQLADEPLLASIQEIQIKGERIYVHDKLAKIVCYDMQGNVIYKIDARGAGPGEYTTITAFAVDEYRKELVVYDNLSLSLLYYNADNGMYMKSVKFLKPTPTAMAISGGTYFYDNKYHINYQDDNELYYSLLVSQDGVTIRQRYFPHNEVESSYHFSPTRQPFSYNDSTLYYARNFDNIVYELSPKGLKALYEIRLPDPLPFSKIEDRPDEWELVKSNYSMGLEGIYKCDSLLYFQFSKGGFLQSALYDLVRKKQIYCGKRLTDKAGKSVPLFRLIDGVYKGKFWGVITPETIDYALCKEPKDYPEIFRKYNTVTDNPVIAFYRVIR